MSSYRTQSRRLRRVLLRNNRAPSLRSFIPLTLVRRNRYASDLILLQLHAKIKGHRIYFGRYRVPHPRIGHRRAAIQRPCRKSAPEGNNRFARRKNICRMIPRRSAMKSVYTRNPAQIRPQSKQDFLNPPAVNHNLSPLKAGSPPRYPPYSPRPPSTREPAQRLRVESEEIPIIAQFSPKGGNGAVMGISELVPVTGLEPVRCRQRWILSPLRLPIPSHRRMKQPYYTRTRPKLQEKSPGRGRVAPPMISLQAPERGQQANFFYSLIQRKPSRRAKK